MGLIKQIKSHTLSNDELKQAYNFMQSKLNQYDAVVLGCTELPLIAKDAGLQHENLLCPMGHVIDEIISDYYG